MNVLRSSVAPTQSPSARFERFATGLYTKAQVLEEFTSRGLRTRRGGELSPQKWGEMLANRAYISRIVQRSWDIDTAGNWPPLVDEDTFWRCQSLLATNGEIVPKERNNPDFPLRGFTTCGHCGHPITGPGPRASASATPTTTARRRPGAARRTSLGGTWRPSS